MTDSPAPTAFFGRTFDEAYGLLVEVRGYVRHSARVDASVLEQPDRLRFALESMRVTTRLSQIMAWLLTEKAVFSGELSRQEAGEEKYRLSGQRICLDDRSELSLDLPEQLIDLLGRSLALYVRVSRLDEMVRRAV